MSTQLALIALARIVDKLDERLNNLEKKEEMDFNILNTPLNNVIEELVKLKGRVDDIDKEKNDNSEDDNEMLGVIEKPEDNEPDDPETYIHKFNGEKMTVSEHCIRNRLRYDCAIALTKLNNFNKTGRRHLEIPTYDKLPKTMEARVIYRNLLKEIPQTVIKFMHNE